MSDSTPIEPLPRWLKSPFNGQAWAVPPEMNPAMYAALLQAGFTEIQPKKQEKRAGPDRVALA